MIWWTAVLSASNNAVDPLARSLLSILSVGVVAALLLALLANLLLPLLSIRARQTSFAVLRALGAAPGQITRLLAWEMALIQGTALLLGLLFGFLLISTSVAPLVFTSALPANLVDLSSAALYALQQIHPRRDRCAVLAACSTGRFAGALPASHRSDDPASAASSAGPGLARR